MSYNKIPYQISDTSSRTSAANCDQQQLELREAAMTVLNVHVALETVRMSILAGNSGAAALELINKQLKTAADTYERFGYT